MRRVGRTTLALMLFSGLAGRASAAPKTSPPASEPQLKYLQPAAVQPGQSIELLLHGTNLGGPTGIWTNLPGAVFKPVAADKKDAAGQKDSASTVSRWQLSVPANTPLGYYGIRLATTGGISNVRVLMVDDLPTLAETTGNKAREAAQPLSLPVALAGTAEAESYDYFRFRAERGQRLAIEVVARRLGSPMDPVIRLLRPDGTDETELAYSDDDAALGADSRLVHTFAASGDYLLEVRDIRYQGGNDYHYRLRLGDFPLVTATYPLNVQWGAQQKLVVLGRDLAQLAPLDVLAPADKRPAFLRLAAAYPGGHGSSPLVVVAGGDPEQVEFEPNNTLETASPIELVGAVNGRFEVPHDRDYFRFSAKKGEHWLLAGRTRGRGLPTDLFMRLYDSAGKQLAEVEDTAGDEGVIDFTFPAEGTYRLMVEDLLKRGGPEQVYRIEIERYQPGFSLSMDVEHVTVPKRGVLAVKVSATRRGYTGPIELKLAGDNLPFTLESKTIAANKKDGLLIAPLTPAAEPGRYGPCQIVGTAKIDGREFSATATGTSALRTALSGLTMLPPGLDGSLAYGIGPVAPNFFDLKPESTMIDYPQLVGKASLKLKATRKGKFVDAIALTVEGLPPGISLKPVTVERNKPEATLEFSGPGSLAEAEYALRLIGKATFDNQPGEVTIDNIKLRVRRPLSIEAVAQGKLVRGQGQPVRIRVVRLGNDKQPIQLAWQDLPPGVSGDKAITIPAGKAEIETRLSAGAGARAGAAACRLVASIKVGDQTLSIASEPIVLEIAEK